MNPVYPSCSIAQLVQSAQAQGLDRLDAQLLVLHTLGRPAHDRTWLLACDGNCCKAWGVMSRPKLELSADPDDVVYLADGELCEAPADPGTYEGGCAKPASPDDMNKWCARECERSDMAETADKLALPDYSTRMFNQPWKHPKTPNT